MRSPILLPLIAFILAGLSGLLFWKSLVPTTDLEAVVSQVGQLKRAFQDHSKPMAILNLEERLQPRLEKELSDPKFTLPQSRAYPFREWQLYKNITADCALVPAQRPSNQSEALRSRPLLKAIQWHQFKCGQKQALPRDFFTTAPFMNPDGQSYVKLALESNSKPFHDPAWILKNKDRLHLLELLNNSELSPLPLHLTAWQLFHLLKGEALTLTSEEAIFLSAGSEASGSRVFAIYDLKKWQHFLENKPWVTVVPSSQACALKESNACWIENPKLKNLSLRVLASILFFGFTLIGFLLIGLFLQRARAQKKETGERLFVLQMLTHELRTPTTSIRLSIEALRSDYDQLPADSQKAFLRICEEMQRLDRVVEASKNYLTVAGSSDPEKPTAPEPYPLNHFMRGIVDSYEGKLIQFEPLQTDCMIGVQAYWLELCVRNLIDNAFHHGKPPVIITLQQLNQSLLIEIKDQGQAAFKSLDEMTKPFLKDRASAGLGLGLAIVQKTIRTLGGELTYHAAPTTFTLRFKEHS